VIFFPSRRQATLGSDTDLSGLARGGGLVSWIEAATNPNPKEADSARRHTLLQEFQQEFAEFIGRRSVSLSVPKYSLPMPNNEQPEINVTIDGRLRLLSQLGAGIGEALIVLLVSKLSQEWRHSPVDILLLEEPELHIHSTLQRKLLDRLAAYGVQIVAATHSPTVVNWFARNGGRVFRTEFIEADNRTPGNRVDRSARACRKHRSLAC
jgi:predicted ATP-dependent endonuclease of OLD family